MSRIRKLAVAAGTFSLALGIGFIMQNGDALAARFGAGAPDVASEGANAPRPALAQDRTGVPEEHTFIATLPTVPGAPAMVREPSAPSLPTEAAAPVTGFADMAADVIPAALEVMPEESAETVAIVAGDNCPSVMTAEAQSAALVMLHLQAPCAPHARVSFLHQGMMFTELTDEAGEIIVTVPALSEHAMFLADVAGGEGAVALVDMPDVPLLDRVVLQWQDAPGLGLHALEFGADYGTDGHVWSGAPHDPASAEGGFLMELGDPSLPEPLLAQVYTFPRDTLPHDNAQHSGEVILSVEAEVTTANCGRELAAQSLQIAPGAEMAAKDLELRMPGCEAEGELLVLPGMLSDIHLAAN